MMRPNEYPHSALGFWLLATLERLDVDVESDKTCLSGMSCPEIKICYEERGKKKPVPEAQPI